jgi:Condensation domain
MSIVVIERIPVAFKGEGEGVGDLSWGQQAIWNGMTDAGESFTMSAVRPLDPGATIEEFVSELAFYLNNFEAMRTLLRFEPDGHILQVVHSSGTAEIEVYDAGDRDPAEVAAEVETRYAAMPFAHEHEWPVRCALVRQQAGALTHMVVAIAHHVADAAGALAMFEDWTGRDPQTGLPPRPPGIQPLAQAAQQQTTAIRQNEAAIRYWEEQLRVMPPSMFPAPPQIDVAQRFWEADYSSPALHLALRALAVKLGVSASAVLYAAFAGALSAVIGANPVATTVTVNNRLRPGLSNAGGPMAQLGLCTLDVAGASFPELVDRARGRLLAAQKYAYYSPRDNDRLVGRISRERGVTFDLRCMFNDRRSGDGPIETVPDEAEIRAAIPATTVTWRQVEKLHQRLMMHVNEHPSALTALVQVDTAYLSRDRAAEVLRRMEDTALEAVLEGDTLRAA